jgi:hypothetical protein
MVKEASMIIVTRAHALRVARRAYGPDIAESLREHLPERLDLDSAADRHLLFQLGMTPDQLASALGAEL